MFEAIIVILAILFVVALVAAIFVLFWKRDEDNDAKKGNESTSVPPADES